MEKKTQASPVVSGIHHITAIAGNPQKNFDFYTKILGLRFIKKTVNFDDPGTYHFYFGNDTGDPGTILTFFPWTDTAYKGRKGTGQITTISFSIPRDSLSFWKKHLAKLDIKYTSGFEKFGEEVILFEDSDGFELELIGSEGNPGKPWENGLIPEEHSIRGFHSVTMSLHDRLETEEVLKLLGLKKTNEDKNRFRFKSDGASVGMYADILHLPGSISGTMGVGAVHHIAWRVPDDDTQLKLRKRLVDFNLSVTPVIDRSYFHSVYFREPGNILFEIATDTPGFLVDESLETLGQHLKLPPWYEKNRSEIERSLPNLKTA